MSTELTAEARDRIAELERTIAQQATVIADLIEERDQLLAEDDEPCCDTSHDNHDGFREFVDLCANDFPCDDLAHRYAATCRVCKAKELLR